MSVPAPVDAAEATSPYGPRYPWVVVGMLWFCGFFNYADRQAVYSVFPVLASEFGLTKTALGMVGSSFMVVYALMAPIAGLVVDRRERRGLVVIGLGFWSLICAATATAQGYVSLLVYRALEGLGESFYFPASMSILADYHGPRTRSRAMGLHQTSVYAGTIGGGALAGWLGERYGWRTPFWMLGVIGMAYALVLAGRLREPKRTSAEGPDPLADVPAGQPSPAGSLAAIVKHPAAVALLAAFAGANFVTMTLLTWLPTFVFEKFQLGMTGSAITGTLFIQLASFGGALIGGGLADRAARSRRGGRMQVQALGLAAAAPCVYLAGSADLLSVLIAALVGIGLTKGIYEANIFASMYDVVPPEVRGTAAGLMNTVGWSFGSLAPVAIGVAGDRWGLSLAIAATAAIYLVAAGFALAASVLAPAKPASLSD